MLKDVLITTLSEGLFMLFVAMVWIPLRKHYGTKLRDFVHPQGSPIDVVARRTEQLERNGGASLADAVFDMRDRLESHIDRFEEHLDVAAEDRRQQASLERRFTTHLAQHRVARYQGEYDDAMRDMRD